jgi:two-component system cell cycle sensor histidine kinase/response regulator CckA
MKGDRKTTRNNRPSPGEGTRAPNPGWRTAETMDSEARYHELVEAIEDVVYIVDGTGIIKYLNTSLERVTGYTREELVGKSYSEIITPESLAFVAVIFARQRRGEDVGTFEVSFLTKGGDVITIETRERLVWENDWIVEVYGIGRDVTERRRTEEALRESERRYRSLFETSMDTVYLSTLDGKFIDINRAGLRLFGYERDDLLRTSIRDLCRNPEDYGKFRKEIEEQGFVHDYEIAFKKKDGAPLDCLITATLREDSSCAVVGCQGIIRDISEKKRLMDDLVATQKMEAVGALAGGIAHDFNNILATILGYASYLRNKADRPNVVTEGLSVIEQSATRASELTTQLLAFSRRGQVDITFINLSRVVKDVYSLISKTFDKSIRILLETQADPLVVLGDQSQLNQIVMNLVINARDAMPDGGILTIKTCREDVPVEVRREGYSIRPGEYACLSVSDTGTGMTSDTLARVFEPYFTTRRDRGGTGLGMSVVYGIVKGHAGYIDIASEQGSGTTVTVYVPLSRTGEDVKADDSKVIYGGTETILVVDDEPNIIAMLTRLVGDFGYTVLAADSGREALAAYQKNRGKIDLVILDVVMPDMRGREVLRELFAIDPEVRVLLTSGYSEESEHKELMALGARGFIGKPFVVERLLLKIREVLREDSP